MLLRKALAPCQRRTNNRKRGVTIAIASGRRFLQVVQQYATIFRHVQASQIIATGLTVNINGGGGNIGAKATGGGIITLNSGTTINFAAGGGGNTGLWATGTGSQIVTTGTNLNMIGGGGGDTGVRAMPAPTSRSAAVP
jgi:hypothetical protein